MTETAQVVPATAPDTALVEAGRRILRSEAAAVEGLAERLDSAFARAVEILHDTRGRVIVTGVGKSGIIARKLAATFTSTGTPAAFLHPVDGLHGDLGIVSREDTGIFLSKSGATSELTGLMQYMVRLGLPILALTGRTDSALGRNATVVLDCGVSQEACPLDLAPTSSTTATLAMGDALAMVLLERKGFRPEDFARFHPGGTLGRHLTLRVEDVMVGEDYPEVGLDATIRDCIVPLAHMRGTVPIVDEGRRVTGVITTGDLTRLMDRKADFLEIRVRDVMTAHPRLARLGQLAGAVVRDMEEFGVMALPVVDGTGRLHGVVHLHDLLRAGVV
jgi:arabinose-5-phosphate isomerase